MLVTNTDCVSPRRTHCSHDSWRVGVAIWLCSCAQSFFCFPTSHIRRCHLAAPIKADMHSRARCATITKLETQHTPQSRRRQHSHKALPSSVVPDQKDQSERDNKTYRACQPASQQHPLDRDVYATRRRAEARRKNESELAPMAMRTRYFAVRQ